MSIKEIISKNNVKKILNLLFAILSVGGIAYYLIIGSTGYRANNLIYIPFLYIYYKLYVKINYKEKKFVYSTILSVITSTIMILGVQLERCNDIFWTLSTLVKIVMLMFAFIPIYNNLISLLDRISNRPVSSELELSKKNKLIIFGTLLFFGILGFLALYPGLYGYDAGYEIMQMQYEDVTITTHFSVIYSYFLYWFVNLGNTIFNSYTIGFAMYSFVQMFIMTFVAAKICIFVHKVSHNKKLLILSTIFFCVFPLHIIMMVSAAQDTLFCGLIALVLIEIYNLAMDTENFWHKIINPIKFVILALLLCVVRNNGLYILLVPAVLTIFFVKKYKFRSIALYAIAIALFFVYKGPILKKMNVVEVDTIREMSSVPCQQIARSYIYKNEVYSEDEKALIEKVFAYRQGELFEYYTVNQSISDSVKATMNETFVKENSSEVIKLYVDNLIEDSENYVEGFLFNSLGFWYPDKTYPDYRIYHPYIEYDMLEAKTYNERYIEIERNSKIPLYDKALNLIVGKNYWNNIPVVSSIFTCGTYFLLLVFAFFYVIYKKKIRLLYVLSLLFAYYLTLLLSPVCIFRYCYALVLCAPIIIAALISKDEQH